jgi:hypothetical protein
MILSPLFLFPKVQEQDVGDPMTAWGFIQPLNANGKVGDVGAKKAEKKRERRRSHSEGVDKKKLTIVTDLPHHTLDAMPVKGRKTEKLGRRQTTQLDANGMPMGVVLQRAQSQETAALHKKDVSEWESDRCVILELMRVL